jgi:hypothetical protein
MAGARRRIAVSALDRIAYFQNRRDEVPNQELARDLARAGDVEGIREIAAGLGHPNQNVQSDCLKVLYEIGYLEPDLIARYVMEFLALLNSRNNRMVWGSMIALATIADRKPLEIWQDIDAVTQVTQSGTVITLVWGIRTLAKVAAADPQYRERLWPVLLEMLRTTIPRDVPTHAESMLCAVDECHRAEFLELLESREAEMTPSQSGRLRRVTRQLRA